MILNKGADGHLYGHQTLHGFEFTNEYLGSIGITFGIVALSCRNFPPGEAQTLLYALGAGFCVIVAIFVSVKIRGFGEFPTPPAIMFAILAVISFYTAFGLVLE